MKQHYLMQYTQRPIRVTALALITAALLGGASASAAETVISFSETPVPVTGVEQKNPGITATIAAAAEADGDNVFKLTWPAYEGVFVAGYIDNGGILIEQPGKYKITAKICVEQLGAEAPVLALRLIDKNWETYQMTTKVTPGEPGWVDVSWTLDTENPKASGASSWGGQEELIGVVNLPLRLRGFATSFTNRTSPGGTLLVDQVTATRLP